MWAIYCFGKLIRYSRRIQSIILSNTGLNSQVLVGLVQPLRHAKSLLCLHLSSNPGINTDVQDYYRERLKILPEFVLKIKLHPEYLGPLNEDDLLRLSNRDLKIRQHKL